jgi:hypothetical protein
MILENSLVKRGITYKFNNTRDSDISGFHGCDYGDHRLLVCDVTDVSEEQVPPKRQ